MSAREPLDILLALTRELTEERPLEEGLRLVTDAALALFPAADHASVRLLDEHRQELLVGARSGVGETYPPQSLRPGEGIAGWVAQEGRAARVSDVHLDDRYRHRPSAGYRVGSILTVPLISAGNVIGVLSISAGERAAFEPEDEPLAQLLANCAVPPIDQARLARLAMTDPHTMTFNRRYLEPRLRQELSRAERTGTGLALLMMDLDHFKRVNDRFGHAAGDRVLRWFADRVRLETRSHDVLVRWGGEEFLLLMPNTDLDTARAAAERIRQAVADAPCPLIHHGDVTQTVSIGVVSWDGHESAESLEERADDAMYAAKRAGRNTVRTDP